MRPHALVGVRPFHSLAVCGGLHGFLPEKSSRSVFSDDRFLQLRAASARLSSLCQEIWLALLGLSCRVAGVKRFRLALQRQRLPADERPGCPDLAESIVLACYLPNYPQLAPRQHQ